MTATMEETKTTSLYYREGSSDKEYHVRLEAKDHGFVVNIAYGRRGSTPQPHPRGVTGPRANQRPEPRSRRREEADGAGRAIGYESFPRRLQSGTQGRRRRKNL